MKIHTPEVFSDGGPWAEHDYACSVCRVFHAVLDLNTGVFQPCWHCQKNGWKLKRSWWKKEKVLTVSDLIGEVEK